MSILLETDLPYPLFHRGKVRDTYDLGDEVLMVATDRISAFDVVLPCGIPDKGVVLNRLSAFWFRLTSNLMPNHLVEEIDNIDQLDSHLGKGCLHPSYLAGRSMVVKKAQRILVECVVRGYIASSVWEEYRQQGTVCGIPLSPGMQESQRLPQPLFTPTTKAESGHDQLLTPEELRSLISSSLAEELKEKSLLLYNFAEKYARSRGIILADTKMEFGFLDGKVILIDELFTPDSSRFWDANNYEVGHPQPGFDKQLVRDWLVSNQWNKEPPAPLLPPEIIAKTTERYREAYKRLTGKALDDLKM